jgi:hypothetical protein
MLFELNNLQVLKPKPIIKHLELLKEIEFTTVNFYGTKWLVELVNYKSTDSNALLMIGIIVGKNHTINTSLRINIASDNLVNFNLVTLNKTKLQEKSHVLKQLMKSIIPTNTLGIITRNASLSQEDIKSKKIQPFS